MFLIQPLSIKDEYDLIINQMSLREKVGQMFFIRLEALDPDYISDELSGKYIKHDILNDEMIDTYNEYPCGGIVLFAKNLNDERQLITLTNNIHNLDNRPLICIDEEGGVVSRIANSNKFRVEKTPNNNAMTTYDDAYKQGYYIGSYLKKYHIDIDFAPVADINSDSQDNAIGERSFGDNPITVSTMVNAFISGLHDNNILLMPENYKEAFDTIIQAINTNQIKEERINESVKRILKLKTKYKLIEPYSIIFSNDYYFKKDDDK